MAFPAHNNMVNCGLFIQLPDDLHYNYSSSAESDSPYTPNFPSPQIDSYAQDSFSSQHMTNVYRTESNQSQVWTDREPFNGQHFIEPIELPKCTPSFTFSTGLPLHAPTPLPKASHLLLSDAERLEFQPRRTQSPQQYCSTEYACPAPLAYASQEHKSFLDGAAYGSTGSLQSTFPTPSELLAELSAKNGNGEEARSEKKTETARRARRRAVAQSVGFVPTDPDTITSHEKKRHYLECLEQYVLYLHQQLHLVGVEPAKLERVSNYRGLSSRSIRTLLVHMENSSRNLNLRTLSEEQRFIALRDAICKQGHAAMDSEYHYPPE